MRPMSRAPSATRSASESDREPARATQDVAPRVVRFVKRRDGGRYCVPGCRSARYVEIHHVVPREAGGSHEPDNLTFLCDGHHRALHQGKLAITGSAPQLEVRWMTHGVAIPRRRATPRLALSTLGYRPHEAREAVAGAIRMLAPHSPLEAILREALRGRSPSARRKTSIDLPWCDRAWASAVSPVDGRASPQVPAAAIGVTAPPRVRLSGRSGRRQPDAIRAGVE